MPISESSKTSAAVGDPIVLREVYKQFGTRKVLQGVNCRFPRGKISVVLGGSGSGKSTLLRLIGGLIRADRGSVLVDGEDVGKMSERGLMMMRKKLGMLFQGGAMLDSYTVFENLALALRETTKMNAEEIVAAVAEALKAVGVEGSDKLLPGQLSGGMLRRVALARAMIRKPGILLVDEPFSGLDPISLKRIEKLLMEINKRFDISMVVVSHDIPSTMRMADHVVLLLDGKVYEGTPGELRGNAVSDVAEFMNVGLDVEAK